MRKILLTAILLIASSAQAEAGYNYPFATADKEFWRLATPASSGALLYIHRGSVMLHTHCFSAGPGQTSTDPSQACAAERPTFDNLERTLIGVTGAYASGDDMVLQGADGRDVMTLVPVTPDGIEFRRLTVTAFRYNGRLVPLHDPNFVPDFVLYDGTGDGSSGCGGLVGDYKKLGPSRYKFELGSILAGMCLDVTHALWRVDKIFTDLDHARDVEARGRDFVLRDGHGREQLILSPLVDPQN